MIEILTLPLPAKALSPNARPNRFAKTAATRTHRNHSRRETYRLKNEWDFPAGFVVLSLTYHAYWKGKGRRRDDVNLIASCKAYEDGIQDAIGQDDSTWSINRPVHHHDPDDPRLEIYIEIAPL